MSDDGVLPVSTSTTLRPATAPTLHFIGVTTGGSSIQRVFPRWAAELGLEDAVLQGVDLPLHADPEEYRRVVRFLAEDPLSRGALVTTHKIDLHRAARDLFDDVDPLARLMGETSCLARTDRGLVASAKDPLSSGLAVDALVPPGHWASTGAEVVAMGAGGSSIALAWHLGRPGRGTDRPARITVTDRSAERLAHLHEVAAGFGSDLPIETVLVSSAADNDRVVDAAPPGSLVVNATGLGKDAPGSPVTDDVRFPEGGFVWELNYRGDLVHLRQARARAAERRLTVADGWVYFLHGWTQVIGEVFSVDIPTSGPRFERLSELARTTR